MRGTKPPAPFRRMPDFVCMSISRIRRYGAGNVCSRLIEFPVFAKFCIRDAEGRVSTNVS